MFLKWEQVFLSFVILGPYLMTYTWSLSFWVRLAAGFLAMSQAASQVIVFADPSSVSANAVNPFGEHSQAYISLCLATGVSGALFCAFSEPLGLLIIQLWGIYSVYTWTSVGFETFDPPSVDNENFFSDVVGPSSIATVACVTAGICVVSALSRMCFRHPQWMINILAGVFGAPIGAHATVQAIYFYWNDEQVYAPLVYGLLAGNRSVWCLPASCKIFYTTYFILVIVSLITQYFVYESQREATRGAKPYSPIQFRHPNRRGVSFSNSALVNLDESSEDEDVERCWSVSPQDMSDTWQANLETPNSCWFFLTVVVSSSSMASFIFTFLVSWSGDTATNFFIGLFYILTNAFCLWSIIEFFFTTFWFHVIRLVCGIPRLPKSDFSNGVPRKGRTILAYCLLSKTKENSKGTMETALEAHLDNLDANMRITTGVISVTSALHLVQYEMTMRDACRGVIRQKLAGEAQAVCRLVEAGAFESEGRNSGRWQLRYALEALEAGSGHRARFWLNVWESLGRIRGPALHAALLVKVEEAASHFIYLHRTSTILKKPGQYQDLMVLASTGNNTAYTYLKADYGEQFGREPGTECFGFSGNVSSNEDPDKFESAIQALTLKGKPDIDLVAGLGADPKNHYFYTMVLDSDTVCPPGSIRSLLEYAEHPSNRSYGIINANLAADYSKAEDEITWHMWRSALMEVSTVNLQRGQFWIFDRVGFYGKGLIRNEMYISRLIGEPGQPVEALPVDILSHDTVEAKLLQPAVATSVTLYEDVARNPISALSQSTRWMRGEVRNSCYGHDGSYRGIIRALTALYCWVACKPKQEVFIRWREVPRSVGAEYLSLTGFRLFHAGPCILMVNMATTLLASRKLGLELEVLPVVGMYAFLFTVLALFIVPKGFLILDKLPSLNLGKYTLCTKRASKVGDGGFKSETEDEEDSLVSARDLRTSPSNLEDSDVDIESDEEDEGEVPPGKCCVLMRQLVLAIVEIVLSVLLFSPELIVGVIRLVQGSWSQVTGSANWQPQEEVENEIRNNLNMGYVWKKCYIVFLAGAAYLFYALWFKIEDVLVWLLMASWLLYPVTTYWMCMPVSESMKRSFLWTWVMDIKRIQ